jgi:protein-disulfide isomerase
VVEAIVKQSHEKTWAFHDWLYEAPDLLKQSGTAIDSLVSSLGLDAERLRHDLTSEEITAQVQRDRNETLGFGFQGTPAFLIN